MIIYSILGKSFASFSLKKPSRKHFFTGAENLNFSLKNIEKNFKLQKKIKKNVRR